MKKILKIIIIFAGLVSFANLIEFVTELPRVQAKSVKLNPLRSQKPEVCSGQEAHRVWPIVQKFVSVGLRSPSTAKFKYGGSRDVQFLYGRRYRVNSWVDSQNGFGATVRTQFEAIIELNDSGGSLIHLKFQ